jgi:peptidyl-prolyl cis-trans isomerase B (cyclophilin B)
MILRSTGRATVRPATVALAVALALAVGSALVGCAPPLGGGGAATPTPTEPPASGPASTCPTRQPEPLASGEVRELAIDTSLGAIVIEIRADLSPIAAGNFVALASCGYYDGVVFHRAATLQDGTPFVIQGGDPTGTGRGGPGYTIADEPVTAAYGRGTVAMARTAEPDSVGSQFFIVLDDAARDVLASYNTYQIIGTVTSGMEAADAIHADADAELPTIPIAMESVTVRTP